MKRKSFILHLDSLSIFDGMTNEQKGELFEAIRQYHLGNEVTLSPLISIIFIPFKNQFDRDLIKYERIVERNRMNGNKGGRPPSTETQDDTETHKSETNPVGSSGTQNNLDSDSDSDSKSDSDNDSKNKSKSDSTQLDSAENEFSSTKKHQKTIEEKKEEFKKSIEPFRDKYDSEMLNDFWRYWTEKNKNGKKMRFEMQKVFDVGRRLITWSKNENNKFNGTRKQTTVSQSRQERVDEVREFRLANQQALADRLSNYLTGDPK